ncbi:MAG: hypothetical protein ACTJLM_00175 [Ehrlichia sp.]
MSLTLVFLSDGTPTLYPSHFLKHNKQHNIFYTSSSTIKLRGVLDEEVLSHPLFVFYGCNFNTFYVLASSNLVGNVLIMVGGGPGGKKACLCVLLNQPGMTVNGVLCRGIKLKCNVFAKGVIFDDTFQGTGSEKAMVLQLSRNVVLSMQIWDTRNHDRDYEFFCYNSNGESVGGFSASTMLECVKIEHPGIVRYLMSFEVRSS